MINDMDCHQLVGRQEEKSTLVMALSTVEKIHREQALQPNLVWRSLHIIKKTIENTTQWGKSITQCPMKKHHVSRFPWSNRQQLNEEVAMDTVFFTVSDHDQSTCAQLFVGLMSRMMNFHPMMSEAGGYQIKSCQDFWREEGVPPVLHRDKASEQAHEAFVELNRHMMVKDSFSEPGNPNQNPAGALGVKLLKVGI